MVKLIVYILVGVIVCFPYGEILEKKDVYVNGKHFLYRYTYDQCYIAGYEKDFKSTNIDSLLLEVDYTKLPFNRYLYVFTVKHKNLEKVSVIIDSFSIDVIKEYILLDNSKNIEYYILYIAGMSDGL